ncbi:XBAT35 [Acrasis kona]|uniref:XBAT35 n=1 Tax=Acrasis kona TaxID=1008807 RepID=A0AAW2YSM7_9EUKA
MGNCHHTDNQRYTYLQTQHLHNSHPQQHHSQNDIFSASQRGDTMQVAKIIYQNPESVWYVDQFGNTAAFYASKCGHLGVIKVLGINGAIDKDKLIRHVAIDRRTRRTVKFFIRRRLSCCQRKRIDRAIRYRQSRSLIEPVSILSPYKQPQAPQQEPSQTHIPSCPVVEGSECVLCLDSNRTHLCVPCGHLAMCRNCAVQIKDIGKCPICRNHTTDCIQLYQV